MIAYKYRLYPTNSQALVIDETIEKCRLLFNKLIELKIDSYKQRAICLLRKRLYREVKGNKEMHSQVSQNVACRVDAAFKSFFRRVKKGRNEKGFPRFKKKGQYYSITLPQVNNARNIGKKTYFPKIGWIKTQYHREINGTAKTITVKKNKAGKYFLIVCCEITNSQPIKAPKSEVGIDLGLNHFVATSDGNFFEYPKPMELFAKKRKKLARCLSRKNKKSHNREKARVKLAKLDEKIANVRNDFNWKLCNFFIRNYGTIYVEDLDINRMKVNRLFAKRIVDASWADFLQKLSYKAEGARRKLVKVDARNTSQKCSECGRMVKKTLSMRTHSCSYCGIKIDRDINASRNILTKGKIGQELSKSTPVGDEATTVVDTTASIVDESGNSLQFEE